MQIQDFTKPYKVEGGFCIRPTIEFTEDEWNTVYTGSCVDKTHYSYLVNGDNYGTFWIPKAHVRLASKK